MDSQAPDLPGNTHQNKASSDKVVPETGAAVGPEASHLYLNCSPTPGLGGVLQG